MSELADDVLVIGLGGNLGGDAAILDRFRRAHVALSRFGPTRVAMVYRTAAIGIEQPDFLNSAIQVNCSDLLAEPPARLIATVLELERALGRDRRVELTGRPRSIDLDVLIWGSRVLDLPDLVVPHPRLASRRFALAPLVDLLGEDTMLPGTRTTLRELLERASHQRLERVSARW